MAKISEMVKQFSQSIMVYYYIGIHILVYLFIIGTLGLVRLVHWYTDTMVRIHIMFAH